MASRYLFVSYARSDVEAVRPIVEAIQQEYDQRALAIHVWIDVEDLHPGQQWASEISRALDHSVGLLVFVSTASMGSAWVRQELISAANQGDRLIIPIVLEHVTDLPAALTTRQWLDLSGSRSESQIRAAAAKIADATEIQLNAPRLRPPVSPAEAPAIAASLAREVRRSERESASAQRVPDSVFIVHGHDDDALRQVDHFLSNLSIRPVVLSRIAGPEQSLFQKFLRFSAEARFAIVILSADDFGASRIQYEADGVGDRALQFRARQNVILELGFFYGYLGWENVFVVYQRPSKVFPNFERPSDLDGVIFDPIDEAGQWRDTLRNRLGEAGFEIGHGHPALK